MESNVKFDRLTWMKSIDDNLKHQPKQICNFVPKFRKDGAVLINPLLQWFSKFCILRPTVHFVEEPQFHHRKKASLFFYNDVRSSIILTIIVNY
jgi:hypothetical protein